MIAVKYALLLILLFQITSETCRSQTNDTLVDFKKYYEEYQVEGSFVLYDRNAEKFLYYNKDQSHKEFTPASTFKILNSLIGLETGVIADENFVIPWDSVKRNSVWDKDYDL